MKRKNTTTQLAIIFSLSIIIGCGTSNHLQETFELGTDEFFRGDYEDAKNLFKNYNKTDSGYVNFESYAFLAECYNKLGMQDSGKIVYANVIHKLTEKDNKLELEDLREWDSGYPKFPDFLKKENGFVSYDEIPEPIGGMRAIAKNTVYPLITGKEQRKGLVLVLTLIDENGNPIDFGISKSLWEPYDACAIYTIRKVKFTIPKRKGKPHKMWVEIPVVFNFTF